MVSVSHMSHPEILDMLTTGALNLFSDRLMESISNAFLRVFPPRSSSIEDMWRSEDVRKDEPSNNVSPEYVSPFAEVTNSAGIMSDI